MKGLILAGGKGTRLYPLTSVTNKHLVPVGNLPMIEYPLFTLRNIIPESISIVTGGENFKEIAGYLAEVHKELKFSFHYQPQAAGIAQAISITEPFLRGSNLAVILGDNIFEDDFYEARNEFEKSRAGAMIFLKEVQDPERFGVAELKNGRVVTLDEKPENPKSNLAVTGIYFYDPSVFDKIKELRPSARGEFEITDLNNSYILEGRLAYHLVGGFWSDAGTVSSRAKCEEFVHQRLEQRVINSLPKDIKSIVEHNVNGK